LRWASLGDICTSIPPLPLQIDTSLLEEDSNASANDNSNRRVE